MRLGFLAVLFCILTFQLPAQEARLPHLFLIGDSTVKNGTPGLEGWGQHLAQFFDPKKIVVENRALGGRSSRSFLREGLWDAVLKDVRSGDFVLIQFGHNDGGPVDDGKARASLKGSGPESMEVTLRTSGARETVLTYGGYLTRYIKDTKARGATPIVCSLVPRNIWEDERVVRARDSYARWAQEVARANDCVFLDLNDIIAIRYEIEGEEKVRKDYFTEDDHTHTTAKGAWVSATCVAEAIRSQRDLPLAKYLLPSAGR